MILFLPTFFPVCWNGFSVQLTLFLNTPLDILASFSFSFSFFFLHLPPLQEYLERTEKNVYYEPDCAGSHCNMFGVGYDCRGCYMDCATCESYLWEEQMS